MRACVSACLCVWGRTRGGQRGQVLRWSCFVCPGACQHTGYSSVGRASDCRHFAVIRWSLVRFRVAGCVGQACLHERLLVRVHRRAHSGQREQLLRLPLSVCASASHHTGYSSVGRASGCRHFAVIRWSLARFRVAGLMEHACLRERLLVCVGAHAWRTERTGAALVLLCVPWCLSAHRL